MLKHIRRGVHKNNCKIIKVSVTLSYPESSHPACSLFLFEQLKIDHSPSLPPSFLLAG